MLDSMYCLPRTKSSLGSPSHVLPSELAASNCSADSLMSLLCLELWPPSEVSVGIGWLILVAGVICLD